MLNKNCKKEKKELCVITVDPVFSLLSTKEPKPDRVELGTGKECVQFSFMMRSDHVSSHRMSYNYRILNEDERLGKNVLYHNRVCAFIEFTFSGCRKLQKTTEDLKICGILG